MIVYFIRGLSMNRLINNQHVIYDTQLLIYYCFHYKDYRILELTTKSKTLTEFLIKHNVKVIVPESVIIEINKKGFSKIIDDYTNSGNPSQIIGLSKNPTKGFRFRLQEVIEDNFHQLTNKKWFGIIKYSPTQSNIDSIKNFFNNIDNEEKLEEFLTKKRRNTPVPSQVDLELIAFSKDMESPVVSNDYDITFFADELFKRGISNRLYHFIDLEYYNN